MKKTIILFSILTSLFAGNVAAQDAAYTILAERDTTVKAKIGSFSLGSRQVKQFVYEYPSTDAYGNNINASGIILVPQDIIEGTMPCDGVIMYNHPTIGDPQKAPSFGDDEAIGALLSNPLKPNYIIVAADYVGYGSSINSDISYICGDTNSRNCLDGLLAAKQLFEDKQIPQGKYLFNLGYSQGGTVSMFASKLTDTEEKYKGIRFDKTFAGGGPLDFEQIYTVYVERDACEDIADVVLMLISVNENCRLGIPYDVMFKEPMASKALEYFKTKKKSVVSEIGILSMDSISEVLTPEMMDINSEPVKKLTAKLKEISLTEGWTPDTTKQYYIEHSRHDNYVPIQSVRGIIPWMRDKGFKPSIVPGKSSLQTCTVVFKLKHQQSAIVWAIQTMAAVQFWPVLYYEGEQNRYYHNLVHDMNLLKVIKTLEGLGLDLRKIINDKEISFSRAMSNAKLPTHYTLYDLIPNISDYLAKVDLTTDDLEQMVEDAGITTLDLLTAFSYIKSGTDPTAQSAPATTLEEQLEGPLYLLRMYEQKLAAWYMLGGYDVNYELWGM